METSRTKIDRKLQRKTSPQLEESILKAKKNNAWVKIANLISAPRRLQSSVNVDQIDRETKEGDTVIIAGRFLETER